MNTGKIPANVGHSMSKQGKIKVGRNAKEVARKLASGEYIFRDGHIVKLK
jgi:hypothetical protein